MNSCNGESKTTVIQHLDDGLVFFVFFVFSVFLFCLLKRVLPKADFCHGGKVAIAF